LYRIAIAPKGVIGLVSVTDASSIDITKFVGIAREVVRAFDSSTANGLATLASAAWQNQVAQWPAEFSFWRSFARRYFVSLCRESGTKTNQWLSPQPPDASTLDEILHSAPPMIGLEYLRGATLETAWAELDDWAQGAVKQHPDGLAGLLKACDETWNLIGRVTFHLAENRKNENAPFAFMATFTEGQSASGAPRHQPLSEALRQSISANDTGLLDRLLEPVVRASKSSSLIADLLESRKLFSPQAWGITQAFAFLSDVPVLEQAGVVVRVPNWWNATRPPRPQVSVSLGSREPSRFGAEQLDLQVGVSVDGEPLQPSELKALLAARDGLMLLRGKWVQVDQEQLHLALDHWRDLQKQHVKGIDFLHGMRLLSGAAIGASSVDDDSRSWAKVEAGPWLHSVIQSLRNPSGQVGVDPEAGIRATLRHYQIDGVRWLWFATRLGLGVCLADDMGLGKTLQVISLIVQLYRTQTATAKKPPEPKTPVLLIVPTSLLGNWQREVAKFAPQLKLFVAHRSVTTVDALKRVEANPEKELADHQIVMTTYGIAAKSAWLQQVTWQLIVLDEAQAIKNANATQTKAIKKLAAKCRITMTGTPVENHLGDLWSLFDFSTPGLLGTAAEFKRFVSSKDDRQRAQRLSALRALVQPYVLRRLKTDPAIVPDLPAKTEMRVDCGLSPTQAALYKEVVDDLEHSLNVATGIQRRGLVLAALMQLKQICNHPSLYLKRDKFASQDSGKYAELGRLCETMLEKQEKLLVFSQFQSMCDPLHEYLAAVFGRPGLTLTGKTIAKARGKLVAEFQQPFGPPYFVISVKAGGTGLNLTEACHVVHFDRWWNPAVEDQATDRAFRIGQQRNVMVHKFVTRGTLEERLDDLIQSKRSISKALFDKSGDLNLTEMTNEQLMDFVSLDLNKATST